MMVATIAIKNYNKTNYDSRNDKVGTYVSPQNRYSHPREDRVNMSHMEDKMLKKMRRFDATNENIKKI